MHRSGFAQFANHAAANNRADCRASDGAPGSGHLRRMAWLGGGSLSTLSLALLLMQQPAFADGGGAFNSAGPGVDNPKNPGDPVNAAGGTGGNGLSFFGGGSGGGAGQTGGAGGTGSAQLGQGGVGGTSGAGGQNAAGLRDGGNGGDASGASRAGGGGGGGGAHGLVSATLPGVAVEAGGNGGAGGAGNITLGVGGGGGAGGYGTVITGTGALGALGVAITGGNGGDGGAGLQGAGSGGSGGVGLFFNGTAPTSFTVNAAVTGGDGGTRGVTGNIQGADGVGGAGLVGQNLTVTMGTGTIAGGLAGDGVTRANAITFTGGNNTISFGGLGTGLTGNIDVTGSLTFAQPAVAIVSNAITGSGSITKTQAGSIVLTGANTYSGGTTVDAGILAVTGAGTLGNISNAVTVSGGALDLGGTTQTQNGGVHLTGGSIVNGTLSSSGSFDLQSGLVSASLSGSGGVSKTTAGTVTLLSGNSYSGGTTITAGTLALSGAGTLGNTGSALIVTGGTLDLGGTSQTVGSLAGNGTVTTSAAGTSTLTVGGSTWTLFFGLIEDGAGQLRLTKAGTGTLSLMNANTYTGVTNLNGGTIEIANSAALGAAALVMSAGTTLRSSAAGLTLSNTIALAPSGTIDTSGNTMTLLGAISGGELTKAGAGTLILANNGNSHIDTKLNAGTIQVGSGGALGSGTLQMLNNTVLQSGAANLIIGNSIRFDAGGSNFTIDTQANTMTLSGIVFQQFGQMGAASTLVKTGSGTLVLSNANNNYTGGTNLTAGAIEVGNNGAVGSGALSMSDGTTLRSGALTLAIANNVGITGTATFDTTNGNFITLSGTVSGGALTKSGAGTLTLANANTYGGGTSLNAGSIEVRNSAALGTGALTMAGGALLAAGVSNLTLANDVIINGGIIQTDSNTLTLSGTLSGGGVYLKVGTGTLVLTGANTNSGGIDLAGGSIVAANDLALGTSLLFMNNGTTLRAGTASVSLANDVRIGGAEITFDTQANAMTLGGEISGGGAMVKNGTGTLTLMGNNTFTGNTTVNSGALIVNGSLASSALTTVNAGATLGGTGTVGNTTIDGGVLSPGNSIGTLTVSGNLIMTAAASYLLEVSPASADRTNVTGTATLGGATVHANFAPGAYVAKQYTILNATGGVNGTFSGLVNTNLPGGFKSSLSYDTNNAYLDLALAFVPPPGGGLSGNQQNVANAIVNFFNSNGSIPIVFGGLTPAGLTQISGETATGSQQATFNAMSQFMGVMTDPFIAGRGNPISSGGSPNAFADEEALAYAARGKSRSKSERDAYAAVYTKVPPLAPDFEQRWSIWGAGFGGSQRTDGNVVLGSNDTRSSIYGVAAGADYRFSPNTIAGFALAGGGTNFSVNGFGGGRSDLFQAGGFIRHNWGPAYVTGALAYGWQDITTDRTVTVAGIDRLRAQFNANAWSGRLEGGYRFVAQGFGWTPYAAGQFATFELPAYAEQVISGANTFALAYSAKSVTATRSELGLRTDKSFAVQDGIFTLRGRAAWAHNFNTDRGALPTFQALPGASFVVNGAAQAPDAALITGSAEMKWISGWSVSATFEGEFSNVTESYAGKGVVRYAW